MVIPTQGTHLSIPMSQLALLEEAPSYGYTRLKGDPPAPAHLGWLLLLDSLGTDQV